MDEDSPNIDDLTFEEKISFLEEGLPVAVQDFLHSPERDAVSLRLSQKYGLRADQASVFERAYLYMLLGVNSPDEFVKDLKSAGIDANTVTSLTTDVNEQVFKKLLKTELESRNQSRPPAVPVMQIASNVPEATLVPTPSSATPSYNLVRPDALVAAPSAQMRTMQSDLAALQHPQATQANSQTIPIIPHPSHITPARSFQTASVPYTSTPVAPAPVQIPHTIPTPAPLPPSNQSSNSYNSDPYRESV